MGLRIYGLIFCALLTSCGGSSGPSASQGIISPSDANAVSEALSVKVNGIEGTKTAGDIPQPSANGQSPLLEGLTDKISVAQGEKVVLSAQVTSSSVIEALFAKVVGADSFLDFNLSGARKSDGSFSIEVQIPDNIANGEFCQQFAVRDAQGLVSQSVEVCFDIGGNPAVPTPTPMPGAVLELSRLGEADTTELLRKAQDVAVSGNYAYVTEYESLKVVDVSDPSAPRVERVVRTADLSTDGSGSISGITIVGSLAYIQGDGLYVVDISNPLNPRGTGKLQQAGAELTRPIVLGNYAYLASFDGLIIVDISNPESPIETSRTALGPVGFSNLDVFGPLAVYASASTNKVFFIDVSSPANPTVLNSLEVPGAFSVAIGDGYVFVGGFFQNSDGLTIINISDPSSPVIVSVEQTFNSLSDLKLDGPTLFGVFSDQLVSYDVTNPALTNVLGSAKIPSFRGLRLNLQNETIYAAGGSAGLAITDVSQPASPQFIGAVPGGSAQRVRVENQLAFVTDSLAGLRVLDVSTDSSPALLSTLDFPNTGGTGGFDVQNGLAVIGAQNNENVVVDVSDPSSPIVLSTFQNPGFFQTRDVVQDGNRAYVLTSGNLSIWDVAAPTNPSMVGQVELSGSGEDLELSSGGYAYVTQQNENKIVIYDVSDATTPTALGSLSLDDFSARVTVINDRAYIVDDKELVTVDLSNPLSLMELSRISIAQFSGAFLVDEIVNDGRFLYLSEVFSGLIVYDTIGAGAPTVVAKGDSLSARSVAIDNGRAYVAGEATLLDIFDVSPLTR